MPNIKSAKKRVIVNKTRAARNKSRNTALKTAIKKFEASLTDGKAAASEAYTYVVKKTDQAVAKGVLHKNTASRKKAQLSVKLNKIGA